MSETMLQNPPALGRLIGVSLGPGDPGLITRAAWAQLQRTDAVWTYPARSTKTPSYAFDIVQRAGLAPPAQHQTLLPLVRERAQRKPLERSIQLHANELRTLRGWISRLPDRPQADYLPRLPEPGALTRAQAERQYVQAMLAHHDAVEQLARRAEGVRLRPALKTLLETVRARSQAERLALQARLDALP